MATLSRDTDNANGKLSDGFEPGKIADRLEIQREAVALSVQTMGVVQSRLKTDKENEIAAKLSAQGLTSEQIAASPEYKQVGQDYGIGGKYWTAGVSFTSALSGLLGGNIQGAAAGAAAPYLANLVKQISSGDEPLRIMLHTALGAFLASAQGGDAAAGAAGALTSAGTADLFIKMFYPTVKEGELTEAQKQVIDNLVVIAGSTAGGLAIGSLSGVGSGANTAKNEVENNSLSLPSGMMDYGQAATSWNQYAVDNNLTSEQTQAGLDKLAKGDLPEGANIAKAIVDGYMDGVLIAGAWYLGPAASIGKVVAGSTIGEIANGSYQWYDLSKTGNENKNWDYWGSASAAITGGLAPGRDIWANTAIAVGGSLFSDGPNAGGQLGTGTGAFLGGGFAELAPIALTPIFGPSSGYISDVVGSIGGEFIGNKIKEKANKKETSNAD